MTISSALNNALSGLRASGKSSEIVSANIANASTPGYAARLLSLSPNGVTGGVTVNGVVRQTDPQLLADRRAASADFGRQSELTNFLRDYERILGTPDQAGSLAANIADFESSLIAASSRPDATERLTGAVNEARDLALSLNAATDQVQRARTNADQSIAAQVSRLNNALEEVQKINASIVKRGVQGEDTSSLLDMRQQVVDEISEMVPVRVLQRDQGAIALYSVGGALLLDGTPTDIGFTGATIVTANQSFEDGELSGLTINGFAVDISQDRGALRGGMLAAQFEIRDESAVEAQTKLDAMARDLIARFEDPTVDPTLAPGDPGLFTDNSAALDPLLEEGLAGRLLLNAAVDPQEGGEVWRLRDGIGATAPGNVGDSSLLQSLSEAIVAKRTPASGDFGAGQYGFAQLATSLIGEVGTERQYAEQRQSFSSAQLNELTERELANGVDTDSELQRLLIIEQAYAANARVIQTVDEMLDQLLRI